MYSEADIQSAVDAGIMPRETAEALREHVAAKRQLPPADEEHFRLLGGFNDIFLTLAIILLLVFPISLGQGFIVAAIAWGLGELVSRKRRLALPSVVLLLTFAWSIFLEVADLGEGDVFSPDERPFAILAAAGIAFAATWVHWLRFRVPMTQAVLAGLALIGAIFGVTAAVPGTAGHVWPMLGVGGVAIFAYAMWWDLSDGERRTHRADIAFWLHLLAAPLIAHSVFREIGVFGSAAASWAPVVLAVYVLFSLVAIIVDRRAILVSGLGYALAAVSGLLGQADGGLLLATLMLGATLLVLGLFWANVRSAVVIYVPEKWRRRLPPVSRQGA